MLILCGGKGERLAPITSQIPKPLVKIKGKPIINYLISYFEHYGFWRFIIAVGYKSQQMKQYFKENHNNLQIEIVDSGDVDIICRLKDAKSLLNNMNLPNMQELEGLFNKFAPAGGKKKN